LASDLTQTPYIEVGRLKRYVLLLSLAKLERMSGSRPLPKKKDK